MAKPPKTPRPQKPAAAPPVENDWITPGVGMIQEKLIGRTVIAWAKLEAAMGRFVWLGFGLDMSTGRIITSRMDATSLIRTLRDLGPLKLREDQWFKLSSILDRIDQLRDDRNNVVHGNWARNRFGCPIVLAIRQKSDAPETIIGEAFSGDRMRTICHKMDDLRLEVLHLMKDC